MLKGLPKLLRFCVSGITAAVVYYVIAYLALTYAGWPSALAGLCAYACSMPAAYYLHRRVTFASTARRGPEAARFIVSSVVGWSLATLLPGALISSGLSVPVALAATCLLVPAMSYLLLSIWVFAPV